MRVPPAALDAASRAWAALPLGVRAAVRRILVRPRFRAGVLAVVTDPAGRVLLLEHRFRGGLPWGLPGGWLEPGEAPRSGMCRELAEELGLEVAPDELRLIEATSRPGTSHIEVFYGLCVETLAVPECFEFTNHGWFAAAELPRAMVDQHRRLLVGLME